jgi:ABC-type multidrug transport system permease subunit
MADNYDQKVKQTDWAKTEKSLISEKPVKGIYSWMVLIFFILTLVFIFWYADIIVKR